MIWHIGQRSRHKPLLEILVIELEPSHSRATGFVKWSKLMLGSQCVFKVRNISCRERHFLVGATSVENNGKASRHPDARPL
jgi:hypothetical protein